LQQELERIARNTRLPERLLEIYNALGNDLFLIEECLARQTLVDRLSRNFFTFDGSLHATARTDAELLHEQLTNGELDPWTEHPRRSLITAWKSEPAGNGAEEPNALHRWPRDGDRGVKDSRWTRMTSSGSW